MNYLSASHCIQRFQAFYTIHDDDGPTTTVIIKPNPKQGEPAIERINFELTSPHFRAEIHPSITRYTTQGTPMAHCFSPLLDRYGVNRFTNAAKEALKELSPQTQKDHGDMAKHGLGFGTCVLQC